MGQELLSVAGVLAAAALVAFLIFAFIFRSYQVDGPSMLTTLHNADKLIIWKVPRSWARITHHDYIPNRGDIVVFNEAGLDPGKTDSKQLIKRVVGLPGERIVVKDGKIIIYNKDHPEGFDPDETLPYGKTTQIPYTTGNIDQRLGPHQIFVAGDNRPESLDSRSFGPINVDQLVGKLVLRVFPVSQAQAF